MASRFISHSLLKEHILSSFPEQRQKRVFCCARRSRIDQRQIFLLCSAKVCRKDASQRFLASRRFLAFLLGSCLPYRLTEMVNQPARPGVILLLPFATAYHP
ncbi:hypothetical protein OIU85_029061, partial [Salix viminalis]